MDRLYRSVSYVGLGLLLTAAGCRSTSSEVPPTKQGLFSRLGQQQQTQTPKTSPESTVSFNQEPRQTISPPYGGYSTGPSGMQMNQQAGMNQSGMNQPGMTGPGGLPMDPAAGNGLGANSNLGGGAGNYGADPGFDTNGTPRTGGPAAQPGSRWPSQAGTPAGNANIGGGASATPNSNAGMTLSNDNVPVINQNPAPGGAGTNP